MPEKVLLIQDVNHPDLRTALGDMDLQCDIVSPEEIKLFSIQKFDAVILNQVNSRHLLTIVSALRSVENARLGDHPKPILVFIKDHDAGLCCELLEAGITNVHSLMDDNLGMPVEVLKYCVAAAFTQRALKINEKIIAGTEGDLVIDVARAQVSVQDNPVHLSAAQFRMLLTMARNIGRPVSYENLAKATREDAHLDEVMPCTDNVLKVLVSRIRQAFGSVTGIENGEHYIGTQHGVGYFLKAPAAREALNP